MLTLSIHVCIYTLMMSLMTRIRDDIILFSETHQLTQIPMNTQTPTRFYHTIGNTHFEPAAVQ